MGWITSYTVLQHILTNTTQGKKNTGDHQTLKGIQHLETMNLKVLRANPVSR